MSVPFSSQLNVHQYFGLLSFMHFQENKSSLISKITSSLFIIKHHIFIRTAQPHQMSDALILTHFKKLHFYTH